MGSMIRIVGAEDGKAALLGTLLSMVFIFVFVRMDPFKNKSDSRLGIVLSYSTCLLFFSAILVNGGIVEMTMNQFDGCLIVLLAAGPLSIALPKVPSWVNGAHELLRKMTSTNASPSNDNDAEGDAAASFQMQQEGDGTTVSDGISAQNKAGEGAVPIQASFRGSYEDDEALLASINPTFSMVNEKDTDLPRIRELLAKYRGMLRLSRSLDIQIAERNIKASAGGSRAPKASVLTEVEKDGAENCNAMLSEAPEASVLMEVEKHGTEDYNAMLKAAKLEFSEAKRAHHDNTKAARRVKKGEMHSGPSLEETSARLEAARTGHQEAKSMRRSAARANK